MLRSRLGAEEDDHENCNDEFPPISLDYENPFQCRQQPSDRGVLDSMSASSDMEVSVLGRDADSNSDQRVKLCVDLRHFVA